MGQIEFLGAEISVLEQLVRRGSEGHRLVVRAKIRLKVAAGDNNCQIARQLEINRSQVIYWGDRWSHEWEGMKAQVSAEKSLSDLVEEVLSDKRRVGAPSPFTAEQIVPNLAIACEKPEEVGETNQSLEFARELADEALKRKIVSQISVGTVGRFLRSGGFKTGQGRVLVDGKPG